MTTFAELSAEGWAVVVTAACVGVGGIVTNVVTAILAYMERQARVTREEIRAEEERQRVKREEAVAKEVETVKKTLEETAKVQDKKLDTIVTQQVATDANVLKIEKATNSMKDALVLATDKEAFLRGGVEERAKADAIAHAVKVQNANATVDIGTAVEEIKEAVDNVPDKVVEKLKECE